MIGGIREGSRGEGGGGKVGGTIGELGGCKRTASPVAQGRIERVGEGGGGGKVEGTMGELGGCSGKRAAFPVTHITRVR